MSKDGKTQTQTIKQPSGQPPMSFSDYITVLRNQIVLSYDGAKEIALKNFDDITKKLVEQIQANQALKEQKSEPKETPIVTPSKESTKRK